MKAKGRPPGAQKKKRTAAQVGFDTITRRGPSRFEYVLVADAQRSEVQRGGTKTRLARLARGGRGRGPEQGGRERG